ncbi:LysR family transcriptional regulator [Collinsella sp. An2]|uniref:LysR family transcriptional regulator n=1 Tax=Collinsella sp. An2 TaxID=1965585 RepID=UPI000B37B55D|nr:LysR family transcriptional regulator [Collinsella sp. An2]OUP08934.1 hypothetical protein B5F33_06100 [Collinsella sp. An2]
MNTMQISCFVEVATQLSFSKAASSLHVSQPTVSHQIKALEDELGCALLTRSTRTVRLTDEGMRFLGYAYEMLDLMARSQRDLAHGRARDISTILKVGVHDGMEAQLIAPVLRALRQELPRFDPVLRMGAESALRDMLETGGVDVVPEYRDPKEHAQSATTYCGVCEMPVVCVCSTDHPLALAASASVRVLDLVTAGRMAVGDPHHCAAPLVRAQRQVAMEMETDHVMMGSNIEVCMALARAGVAFALMPQLPKMAGSDLCTIPVEDIDPIGFGVRVRRGRRSELVDRFIAALGREFRS